MCIEGEGEEVTLQGLVRSMGLEDQAEEGEGQLNTGRGWEEGMKL